MSKGCWRHLKGDQHFQGLSSSISLLYIISETDLFIYMTLHKVSLIYSAILPLGTNCPTCVCVCDHNQQAVVLHQGLFCPLKGIDGHRREERVLPVPSGRSRGCC